MSSIQFLGMIVVFFPIVSWVILMIYQYLKNRSENSKNESDEVYYVKNVIRPLTEEQIDEIHKRGNLTPEEKVQEWESFNLCVPGDYASSAAWRCKIFGWDCHKCLCDLAASKEEWEPMEFKLVNKMEIDELNFKSKKLD